MIWDLGLSENRTESQMLGLVACVYINLSAWCARHCMRSMPWKTERHTIGLKRLWRDERPDKVGVRQTEHAKGTPSHAGRWEGAEKGPLYHFYCPSPFPSHPPWVESMRREIYSAQPLRREQGELENTCACLLEERAFARLSVNLKTVEMNKGSTLMGVCWVCTLIQSAKRGSFVMSWLMRLWMEDQPLDSCCHQYKHCGWVLDLFFFHDGLTL